MGNVSKDLGPVSAYALAVAHGFAGTEDEWAKLQAQSGVNARATAENAAAAANSAAEAENYKSTALRGAEDAQTSADSAAGSAEAAASSATAAQESKDAAAESAAKAEAAAKEAKDVQASIPADYTQVATDVSALKDHNAELSQTLGFEPSYISPNVFNTDDPDILEGGYIDTSGAFVANTKYFETGFIPCSKTDVFRFMHDGQFLTNTGITTAFYDESKTFFAGSTRPYSGLTTGNNAAFYRVLVKNEYRDKLVITKNDETLYDFVPYGTIPARNRVAEQVDTSAGAWTGKGYISHGDSITWQDGKAYQQGDHVGALATGYQSIFVKAAGVTNYANCGKSGYAMAVVNGNGVVNEVMAVDDYAPFDLCTISCGTNDFKLNVPLGEIGSVGDTGFDTSTFIGAYRAAVEYLLTQKPTIRIVLLTPLQRDNAGYDVNKVNSAGHKLIDYVNAVKAIGEMYALPVCDMYSNSGINRLTLSTYTMDGLHPDDVGYKRMGDYLTHFLFAVGN